MPPPPSPCKRKVLAIVCAALSFMALLTGCDEVYEFLGMGGVDTPEKPKQPGSPEEPELPGEQELPEQPVPLAEGGGVVFMPEGKETWEVHTFTESGTLMFFDGRPSVTADYLIVAGGGGANVSGSGGDQGGGGGAGGLLYETDRSLLLNAGSVDVVVGAGGSSGQNGGDSSVGSEAVPGGGGGGKASSNMDGKDGGSGGGSGAGAGNSAGTPGKAALNVNANIRGHNGGKASVAGGGGGGGAGGVGKNGSGDTGGAGGPGWRPSENDAAWIEEIEDVIEEFPDTGIVEFSHGGAGGTNGLTTGTSAANYGDGGEASSQNKTGKGGIVIIRFKQIQDSLPDNLPAEDTDAQ